MTQTLNNLGTVLEGLALIALYWGGPVLAVALAVFAYNRSKVRYHVGNPHSKAPVQTFRSKKAAVDASVQLYKAHGRAFRITKTR